jgi:hypothetical protein
VSSKHFNSIHSAGPDDERQPNGNRAGGTNLVHARLAARIEFAEQEMHGAQRAIGGLIVVAAKLKHPLQIVHSARRVALHIRVSSPAAS